MCVFSEYLDYENCRKKLVDKLIDECTKTVEEVKLANITFTKNENSYYKCSSCKVYIVLIIVICTIFTGVTIGLWLKIIMFLALNLILAKKQKFSECEYINGKNKTNKY